MALATLSIDIVAKLASLEEGMSKATRVAEKNAAAIEARYQRMGAAVRAVGGALAGAFTATALIGFVRDAVNGIDALNDLKDATGASIEKLSGLEDVALRTGTSVESMGALLIKFNKTLSDAKPGSEAAGIFKALGLDVEKLKAIDPAEALRRVAVALAGFADGGDKARAVQELFGKSVREAAPFLNELAKQGQLNATVTTQQAEAAERFNQQLASLQKNSTDAARSIVSDLIPALEDIVTSLNQRGVLGALEAFDRFVKDVNTRNQNLVTNLFGVPTGAEDIKRAIAGIQAQIKAGGPINQYAIQQLEVLEKRLAAVRAVSAPKAGGGRGFINPDEVTPPPLPQIKLPNEPKQASAAKGQIDDNTRALAQYVAQLERERGAIADLSDEQKALNFLKTIGTTGEIPQVRELVLGLAAQNDQLKDQADLRKLQISAEKELESQRTDAQRNLANLIEQTPVRQFERLVDLTGELDEAFRTGRVGSTQYAQALKLIDDALAQLKGKGKSLADEQKDANKALAATIQGTLGASTLAVVRGDFKSIASLWGDMIQQMLAEALAAKLGRALLGDVANTGSFGGAVGGLLSLFGFAKGGAFDGGVQAFAQGGVVGSPTLFKFAGGAGLMGEAGPEAIMPLRRGRDGKLGVAAAGGGGGGNIIINVPFAGIGRAEAYSAMQLAVNALRGEFRQTLRNAGVA